MMNAHDPIVYLQFIPLHPQTMTTQARTHWSVSMNQNCLCLLTEGFSRYQLANAQTCFVPGRAGPSLLGNAWNPRSRVGGDFTMLGHRLVREVIVGTALGAIWKTSSTSGNLVPLTHTSVILLTSFCHLCFKRYNSAVFSQHACGI